MGGLGRDSQSVPQPTGNHLKQLKVPIQSIKKSTFKRTHLNHVYAPGVIQFVTRDITLSDSLELQNKVIKGFESYLLLTFSSNSIQSSLIGNPSAPGCEQKFFQTQICWKRTMPASPPQLASLKYGEVPSKCFSFPYM